MRYLTIIIKIYYKKLTTNRIYLIYSFGNNEIYFVEITSIE